MLYRVIFNIGLVLLRHISSATAFQNSQNELINNLQHRPSHHCSSPLYYAATKDKSIVQQNKQYLIHVLDFTDDKIQDINQTTNILTLDIGILEERANWLQQRLSLDTDTTADNNNDVDDDTTNQNSRKQLKKILQQHNILGKRSDTNLAPTLDYLQSRLLLDDKSLRKLILSAPHLLGCSIEENIEPKLDWLQQRLSLTDVQLSRMICRQSYTLGCSVIDNLEPTISWLQQRLALDDITISKMIQSNPQIIHLNIESNLEPNNVSI